MLRDRGVSPVVGTILMVAIVILLASLLMFNASLFAGEIPGLPEFGSSAGSGSGVIFALDDSPETTVQHRVEIPIPGDSNLDGDSLNTVTVDYKNDTVQLRQSGTADVTKIGIDEDEDNEIETSSMSDLDGVSVLDGGDELGLSLGGNHNLNGGMQVIVVYDAVQNPPTGVYPAAVTLNGYPDLSRLGTIDIND